MKIKIPEQIRIGVHDYSVCLNAGLVNDEKAEGGFVDFQEMGIQVLPQLSESRRNVVFLHEFVHIVEDASHFNIDEQNSFLIAERIAEFLLKSLGIELDWSDIPTHAH